MKNRKIGIIIINILIITAVLAIAFLSQRFASNNLADNVKNINPITIRKSSGYSSLADSGLSSIASVQENIYDKISAFQDNAEVVGENVKNGAITQVNNLKENSVNSTKKFIAEKILQMIGVSPQDIIGTENSQCPQ